MFLTVVLYPERLSIKVPEKVTLRTISVDR
jgi:hypothetical protein